MKRFLTFALGCFIAVSSLAASKPAILKSPDNRVVVSVERFKYSVKVDGKQILAPSEISMTLTDGTVYGGNAKLVKLLRKKNDQTVKSVHYKKEAVRDCYNQMTLSYKNFDLVFRAYNEGVAYRFVSKSKSRFAVKSEQASFAFPDNWKMYAGYCNNNSAPDLESQTCCSYENVYSHVSLKEWDKSHTAFLPLMVEADNGYKIVITESDVVSYPCMHLYNGSASTTLSGFFARCPKTVWQGGYNELQGIIKAREDLIAKECKAGRSFPWRIIQIAREDRELANSDMVWKLATPAAADKDWNFIKPGKVAWDWWNNWNITGVDFKVGVNNDTYKYYIDFASDHGIEYVILDEGWAVNKEADMFKVIPEIDLEELVAYANSKNVGLILWGGYWAVNKDPEQIFLHYSMMGIKGFKIDFMDRDDQEMVDFYTKCAEMGQKYRMMVDFHGAFKPTGLQRTYPNVVNFEAVHGLEQMKWEKSDRQVEYDVTIPFIRMVAGPMDYTQGAMRNATKECYSPIWADPMSLGTRCRQLAEYVIFESPLNMLCDSPTHYMAEPKCTEFIAAIPTTWDETIALNGQVAEFVSIARRKADNWYIGSMTNWNERDVTIDLSFLPQGKFRVEVFKDGKNADRNGNDFAVEELTLDSTDKLKIHMAPGGGYAAKLTLVK